METPVLIGVWDFFWRVEALPTNSFQVCICYIYIYYIYIYFDTWKNPKKNLGISRKKHLRFSRLKKARVFLPPGIPSIPPLPTSWFPPAPEEWFVPEWWKMKGSKRWCKMNRKEILGWVDPCGCDRFTIVRESKLVDFTYLRDLDLQPTYIGVITHLLSTMDIPVASGKLT